MGRPFRPDTGPHQTSAVLAELAHLWDQAVRRAAAERPKAKQITQTRLARESEVALQTINDWATGKRLPRDLDDLRKVGATLARWAGEEPATGKAWSALIRTDQRERDAPAPDVPLTSDIALGRPLEQVSDPFLLEVHRPIEVDAPHAEPLPVLPPYVPREHDQRLAQVVARAVGGHSAMAVLVGGSSTGKTRACWEALAPPREVGGWRLWHPFDPTRPEAALAELPRVGPRTVVWLNETQFYLDAPGNVGERVAAALRTLLTDLGRAPVLVLGTLWPRHWDTLTRSAADAHAQAQVVLAGTDIAMSTGFTGDQERALRQAASGDVRLAEAVANAVDGEVTQYLAGVPELLARYHHAPPAAKALIHAAMDARRLGHRHALPHALLAAAAPAYLSDAEWDAAGEDGLEAALAYTAAPCKGVPGPLTRIRPRSAPAPSRRSGPAVHTVGGQPTAGESGPVYRLADYLDQHGRRHRSEHIPLGGFWAAVATAAHPGDLLILGYAAHNRGLLRDAAQLYKHATGHGDTRAALSLIQALHDLYPADPRPAEWAAEHATVEYPDVVAELLEGLQDVGAREQVSVLATRAAEHTALDDPYAVARLLVCLREAGAHEQVSVLLARDPARHAPLDHAFAVAQLLGSLRDLGAHEQVSVLATRAAEHTALDDPYAVAGVLDGLRAVGAREQVSVLDTRAAEHTALDDPSGVARLLGSLREAGAHEQVSVLLARDPAGHAPLDDPYAVAELLGSLREVGAHEQVSVLLARDPARHAPLDDPYAVTELLDGLWAVGAREQVSVLATRATEHALNDPYAVARLLGSLWEVGAHEQVSVLLARDPARHAPLDDLYAVTELLDGLWAVGAREQVSVLATRAAQHAGLYGSYAVAQQLAERLRETGAHEQVSMLIERLPAAGLFYVFCNQEGNATRFRFGRGSDGQPAQSWDWDDLS
ncbi:hypothetical protein GCM10022226_77820 [Sphaerisporangium flaviroseum]|uniref:HTH cro/C1-type domain-containing protein n=1 Tax=Sphaerisporangium flaviroseum TaxID=509199 RepID=A0ABP7JG74_9ACTN